MSLRLDGINPLAYMGVKPSQPPNLMVKHIDPTANDFQNINVGTFWLVYPGQKLWILISVVGGTATWVQLYPAGGGGGGASQFPTDDGIANEAGGILNIVGDGNIITHGAGNTVTLTMAGDFVENFQTDSGTAHPSSNTLRVVGGTNINTSGASNAVTINLDNSVGLSGTLDVAGTSTFDGNVLITTQPNGVLQTNGSGLISATNGTNGQLLIGGGTAPVWANLTSLGGTVIITNGANSINLESTGGGGGTGAGSIAFYAYQPTRYNVPLTITSGYNFYDLGTAVPLTITVNEGAGFYAGDGISIPASFTAPVKGLYQFHFKASLQGGLQPPGPSALSLVNGGVLLNTPTLTYCGSTGNPSQNITGNVQSAWTVQSGGTDMKAVPALVSAIVQLEMGDLVTFGTLGQSASNTATTSYTVAGLLSPTGVGPGTCPATYVEGFLLKEL